MEKNSQLNVVEAKETLNSLKDSYKAHESRSSIARSENNEKENEIQNIDFKFTSGKQVLELSSLAVSDMNGRVKQMKSADAIKKRKKTVKQKSKEVVGVKIDNEETKFLIASMQNMCFLSGLKQNELNSLTRDLVLINAEKGKILFEPNEESNFFYLIKNGEVTFKQNGRETVVYSHGDFFGEIALLKKVKRTGRAICSSDCEIYILQGSDFRKEMRNLYNANVKDFLYFIDMIPILRAYLTR